MTDSPRWCDICKGWSDHHTDRHGKHREVEYDPIRLTATFFGPGGFTQYPMPQRNAEGIAQALRIPFKVRGREEVAP